MSFAAGAGDESNCRIPAMNGILTAHNIFLALFLSTAIFVQLRGRVHHKLSRLIADHANLMAPYNTLMYLFSAVEAKPYAEVHQFPELGAITSQWRMIREEALKLFDEGYIRAATKHNDIGFNSFFRTGWK